LSKYLKRDQDLWKLKRILKSIVEQFLKKSILTKTDICNLSYIIITYSFKKIRATLIRICGSMKPKYQV
jgi:hypothetical protein